MDATDSDVSPRKVALTDLNQHIVCVLCFGYFIDATTIIECMHTFCKSCIVSFLSEYHHCPHCDTMLSRTRPLSSLRPDRMMQSIVYKTVPGLFQNEMRRRLQFYQNNASNPQDSDMAVPEDGVFNPEDSISLAVRYYHPRKSDDGDGKKTPLFVRYFRCPAMVPVHVLKSLIKTKHRIPDSLRVEMLYGDNRLSDSWTLMEVGYIFGWSREAPMELTFQVIAVRIVKRKRLVLKKMLPNKRSLEESTVDVPKRPSKTAKTEKRKLRIESPPHYSLHDEPHHHRPPTPPETPERISEDHQDPSTYSRRLTPRQDDQPHTSYIQDVSEEDNNATEEECHEQADESIPDVDQNSNHTEELDPDSDAPLEVDTSHDTEQDDAPAFQDSDQLQEPKLETLDENLQERPPENKDSNSNSEKESEDQTEEGNEKTSQSTDENKESESNPETMEQTDDSDVLDFSCHARTVRAQRESSVTSSTPSPSPPSKETKTAEVPALPDLTKQISQNGLDHMKLASMNPSMLNPSLMGNRPPLSLDWARPGFPGSATGLPPSASFRDLMTLSQAAVQLQLAMAHAQAQAQVQAQKLQAQENVLKNLKASESLSFINGSGDTLTISPIAGTAKQKQPLPKPIKPGPPPISRKNNNCKSIPNNNVVKKILAGQLPRKQGPKHVANGHKISNSTLIGSNKSLVGAKINGHDSVLKSSPSMNGSGKPNGLPVGKFVSKPNKQVVQNSPKHSSPLSKSPKHVNGSPKTLVPKSALASLKIPYVQVNSSKTPKQEKDKKEVYAKNTNIDEPFKITNQKLIECIRQQRLQSIKMKSSHPSNSSSETNKTSANLKSPPVQSTKIPDLVTSLPTPTKTNGKQVTTVTSSSTPTKTNSKQVTAVTSLPSPTKINVKQITSATSQSTKPPVSSAKTPLSTALKPVVSLAKTVVTSSQKPVIVSPIKPVTKPSSLSLSTPSSVTIRTTNTSVRQIPNPSRLHQQSENRLSAGRSLVNGRKSFVPSTGDRLESLTRTLHEKVAASAAGIVNSLAR